MSTIPIQTADTYWSEEHHAVVENRGANFGRITVYHRGTTYEVEAELSWAGKGRISHGNVTPTRDQKNRAILALAESPWGEFALGVTPPERPRPKDPTEQLEEAIRQINALTAELSEVKADALRYRHLYESLAEA